MSVFVEKPSSSEGRDVEKLKLSQARARERRMDSAARPKTKVVVRKLPHNLGADAFFALMAEKYPPSAACAFRYFVAGRTTNSKTVPARAYYDLATPAMALEFYRAVNGCVLIDAHGAESRAVVEFAPSQKTWACGSAAKKDHRENTLAEDPLFVAFAAELAKPKQAPPSA
jgi:hypothetical protein